MHHDHEYNAILNSAALIDISPLFKYRVTGRYATKFVNRVISRDINKVAVDQVIYCCWCDPEGKVIDDGTITRLGEDRSEEHTSELQSRSDLVCRLLLEKKKKKQKVECLVR